MGSPATEDDRTSSPAKHETEIPAGRVRLMKNDNEAKGVKHGRRERGTADTGVGTSGAEQKRESGVPGGGQGRRDEVGHSGVYPVSASEGASPEATVHGEASWGQGERGAAGYEDSGGSELTDLGEEKGVVGGATEGENSADKGEEE